MKLLSLGLLVLIAQIYSMEKDEIAIEMVPKKAKKHSKSAIESEEIKKEKVGKKSTKKSVIDADLLTDTFNQLYNAIDYRDVQTFKDTLRPLIYDLHPEQYKVDPDKYERNRELVRGIFGIERVSNQKSLLDIAQIKADEAPRDLPKAIAYIIIGGIITASSIGKIAACPPKSTSITPYTNAVAEAGSVGMAFNLLRDCYYLSDKDQNQSLSMYMKLRKAQRKLKKDPCECKTKDEKKADKQKKKLIRAQFEHAEDFCPLRKAVKERDLSKVNDFLKTKDEQTLKDVLLAENKEGHKPIIKVAREYCKQKNICPTSQTNARLITTTLLLAINFFEGYLNFLELSGSSRECSIQQKETALGFTGAYAAFTLFYSFIQFAGLNMRTDHIRMLNNSLKIYRNIMDKQEELEKVQDLPV